ncbi:amino acid ABC transporter permease [Bacillus sp. PS06]|uniref:amino acid ABC transporter permease n=1 Tax=Bacillus sp. PS06 TaxID=2764176 RepID=UPI00177F3B03|nr:amino acid ABC transporter permease [Bacillus sp. PS06]MBD8069685.1 amino acid ABC transporter permease [Bacillus sp. PS06]
MEQQLEVNRSSETVAKKPPRSSLGVVGWIQANLFSSWINSLLTIVASVVIGTIGYKTVGFIVSADWAVISVNFRLLLVGQFPIEEIWRIWVGLTLLSVLLGFSWGIWKGSIGHVAMTIGVLMLIMAIVPFVTMNTRLLLAMNIVLMLGAFFIGHKLPKVKIGIFVLWILYIPIVITILNGFGVLPPVRTGLWGGFLLTLLIASVSIVLSFPIGVLLALGRRSKLPIVKWFCIIYIEFIRGIPLITVLFVMQLMLPLFLGDGITIDNVVRAMTGFTLFSAAYLAENIRGGLQSLPRGQFEAAQALGLSQPKMMGLIILPQALRAVIPAMVGQFIGIFKDTSLVAIVGLTDLLGMGKKLIANPEFLGKQMEVLLFIAVIYFIFCYLMSHVSKRLEVSLGLGKR